MTPHYRSALDVRTARYLRVGQHCPGASESGS